MTTTNITPISHIERIHRGPPTLELSVVIVSYNTRDLTVKCVQSVFAQGDGIALEVIVVDNASADGSVEALRAAAPQATVIASPANVGFAAGNNLALASCRGGFILLLNPDTELRPSTLRRCLARMRDDPSIGVLGCRVRYESGEQQMTTFRFLRIRDIVLNVFFSNRLLRKSTLLGDQRYASNDPDSPMDVDTVAGCFMLVRLEVLQQVGTMDESFFMYGEEAEWCFRIWRAGWRVNYFPAVEIMHHGAASTGQQSIWKTVEMAKSQIIFMRRTRGTAVAITANAIMLLRDTIRLCYVVYLLLHGGERARAMRQQSLARLGFHAKSLFALPGATKPLIRVVE